MAYDEVGSKLANYKKFASTAARELLGKTKAREFITEIERAVSEAQVSRIMTAVRRAI